MAKVKGSIPFMGLDVNKESGAVTLRFAKRFAQLVDIRGDFVRGTIIFLAIVLMIVLSACGGAPQDEPSASLEDGRANVTGRREPVEVWCYNDGGDLVFHATGYWQQRGLRFNYEVDGVEAQAWVSQFDCVYIAPPGMVPSD